jgi:hypothetical protein
MTEFMISSRLLVIGAVVCALSLFSPFGTTQAATPRVEHRLEITLAPGEQKLTGRDLIRIPTEGRRELAFHLSARARVLQVFVNGLPRAFDFTTSELIVPLEAGEHGQQIDVDIRYESVFKDPLPLDPLNTDNPGYGVTAAIAEKGAFLLSGAGWYPELRDSRATYRLRVQAPEGMIAVTAGRSLGRRTYDGATVSDWLVDHPLQGLALSAAAYEIHEQQVGDILVSVYLFQESRDLAQAYLKASEEYIRLFSDLFGPYPFPKFAVVENFFPTGYGFPSYTLLGSSVLRLPFIIHTSLGHEIAHSWWGNGVYVNYDSGNWGEGLTTYVSDYLFQERKSTHEARDYRMQATRNYSTLVPPEMDFPLSEFSTRTDPITKAVGYDKGAMVFHMLRMILGDEPFWNALRDLYRERLFRETSWKDLQAVFERRANRSLEGFFRQWVDGKSAPRLRLEDVRAESDKDRWGVEARLVQDPPYFDMTVNAVLECDGARTATDVSISGKSSRFRMECQAAPRRLTIDPDHHLLRRLDTSEIPPAVNLLKSSPSVLLVLCGEGAGPSGEALARTLATALGLKDFMIVSERNFEPPIFETRDVILVGFPLDRRWLPRLPAGFGLEKDRFTVEGREYRGPSDAFFGVFRHPYREGGVLAVFLPLAIHNADMATRKVTHYGRYSYLTFQDGTIREKGFWSVEVSPLVHNWDSP